jgi:hypothetical protein
MVILVSEDSNGYAHLFLIEREYFGFNTLKSVVGIKNRIENIPVN